MPLKKSELYSSLWKSCDELRGGMDASQYKDYVLVLLFVKYVSDKASSQKGYLLDVPTGGRFADIVTLKGDKEIGDGMNKIVARLAEANDLKGVIDVADCPTAEIWKDNTLAHPHFKASDGRLKTFDFVVANPSFSNKAWTNGFNPEEDEFRRFPFGVPPRKNGEVAFLRFAAGRHCSRFFLYEILSTGGQERIRQLMSGNAITRLTLRKIRSLHFAVPKLDEQIAIASVLSDMDAEIAALEARVAKTRTLKQGMMQELLTGRIRLPVPA